MFMSSMEFDLGDDIKAMREAVHRWSQDSLKPLAAKIDKDNYFPDHLWREMGDLGILGITVDGYGGADM
ncbi:MAG: acyl-CoA dehydrogenase family protein, partial [Paracoccaceae bacterium]|nr:acyl-CoA dehydrogenase family protein [Paracoccaceae bacterium]